MHLPLRYTIALLSIFFIQNISAQTFPQLYFENLTTLNGLSDNNITCIFQDRKGFLWVGTINGLNKYDGNRFETFFAENGNKNSLSGNSIVDIIEDSDGIFWIATKDGGLTRYDPSQNKDKQFIQFKKDTGDSNSMISNRMTAVYELDKDYILISTENISVAFVNKKSLKITYALANDSTFVSLDPALAKETPTANNWVHHFSSDKDHYYISFLATGRVYAYNKNNSGLPSLKTDLVAGSISHFEVDNDTIWAASWKSGLYMQLNPAHLNEGDILIQKKVLDCDAEVTFVYSWNNDILLAATRTSGIYMMNKHDHNYKRILHDRSDNFSLASNKVNCILKDKNGLLWVGTNAGLSKYNPAQWQFSATQISDITGKEITHFSIYSDNEKTLRVCTSEGIYKKRIEDTSFTLTEYSYHNSKLQPTTLIPLQNGNYILNTESHSYYYSTATENISLLENGRYSNDASTEVLLIKPLDRVNYQVRFTEFDTIDQHPIILFGVMGWGLGIFDESEDLYYDLTTSTAANSLSNNLVRVLFKDSKGDYWVGTTEGLNKWKKGIPVKNNFDIFLHNDSDTNSISNNNVTGILEDENGHLWITTGDGLNEFNGETFQLFNPAQKGKHPMYGIYADNKNNLWTAVPGGFQVFNRNTKTFRFISLLNADWHLKYPAAILKQEDGKWIYGAGNYLVNFNPDTYFFEDGFPTLYLSDFSVFDDHIYHTDAFNKLEFSHSDNFITIEFSSLQLSQPRSVNYQYQLEGLNSDWIDIGNTGKVAFTSLPPGHYKLNIKVTNPQGDWSSSYQMVQFVILKPYWQQLWFLLCCIMAITGLSFLIIRYREKQLMKLHNMRNKIANDLHDDVGSALSTINLYSEVAKMRSENESNDLKSILDKISYTSIEMQENMSHIVWSLQPRNDNFEQMMLRMRLFALEVLNAKNIKADYIIDEKLKAIKLSPAKRKELFLIFKEAINNIIKSANATEVKISFKRNKNDLVMHIEDNGDGFDVNDNHVGNGLHTMKERAKFLKGKIDIISAPNRGTSVILSFRI